MASESVDAEAADTTGVMAASHELDVNAGDIDLDLGDAPAAPAAQGRQAAEHKGRRRTAATVPTQTARLVATVPASRQAVGSAAVPAASFTISDEDEEEWGGDVPADASQAVGRGRAEVEPETV